jgi:thiol-disulfide isomerase/thioredoxin
MSHRRQRSVTRVLLLVALQAAIIAGCGGPPADTSGGETAGTAGREQKAAPDFSLEDLEGKTVRLSDSGGKVRLVDFWATWCAPCREEIPQFKELYAQYKDQGFELIGIAMDEEGAKVVRPFVEKHQVSYTNLLGNEKVEQAFGGVLGYPTAFFIDRDGKIVDSYVGGVPKRVFEARLRELLGLGAAS